MSKYENAQVSDVILGSHVAAIQVTESIGDIKRTVRYELRGGEPVEVWHVDGDVYIIPKSEAEQGRFPWREKQ